MDTAVPILESARAMKKFLIEEMHCDVVIPSKALCGCAVRACVLGSEAD